MSEIRYCHYCDAYRERLRCEACGWTTSTMAEPPLSSLPPSWRQPLTPAPQPERDKSREEQSQ